MVVLRTDILKIENRGFLSLGKGNSEEVGTWARIKMGVLFTVQKE